MVMRQVQVAGGLPRGRARHLRHPYARPRRRAEGARACATGDQGKEALKFSMIMCGTLTPGHDAVQNLHAPCNG